jgi:hypothetical protein
MEKREMKKSVDDIKALLKNNKHFTVTSLKIIKNLHQLNNNQTRLENEMSPIYRLYSKTLTEKDLKLNKLVKNPNRNLKNINSSNKIEETIPKIIEKKEDESAYIAFEKEFQDEDTEIKINPMKFLNLNQWEQENLSLNIPQSENLYTLTNHKKMRQSIINLNFSKTTSKLFDFLNHSEKEEEFIIMQSINPVKNFDFGSIHRKSLGNSIKISNNISEVHETPFRRKTKSSYDAILNKYHEMKSQIHLENSHKVEEYKKILKDRIQKEQELNKEAIYVIKQINFKKNQKIEIENDCREIFSQIIKTKQDYEKEYENLNNLIEKLASEKDKVDLSINNNDGTLLGLLVGEKEIGNKNDRKFLNELEKSKKIQKKQSKLRNLKSMADSNLNRLNFHYQTNLEQIERIDREIKTLKFSLHKLLNYQKKYYLETLQRGIDVRSEGLSWIVKKLLDLDCEVESSKFPLFLEKSHIDYIIKTAQKSLECNYYKIILKFLKNKLKTLREKNEDPSSIDTLRRNSEFILELPNDSSFPINKTQQAFFTFNKNIKHGASHVFKFQEELKKLTYNQKLEEATIELIADNLKKKMKKVHYDEQLVEVKFYLSRKLLALLFLSTKSILRKF